MTIDEQMVVIVNELAKGFGRDHIVTRRELFESFSSRYGRKEGSIIPSDYCYNRVNNGITLDKPAVFEFLGRGRYRCLGSNYPYNGLIYHKPRGHGEFIVGKCIDGERVIAAENLQILC